MFQRKWAATALFMISIICPEGARHLEAATSETTVASPPFRLSVVSSVRLSPEVFRFGDRLRIRNLSSGAQIVVNINSNHPFVSASVLSRLVSSPDQEWLPEFSVLASNVPRKATRDVIPPALRVRRSVLESRGQSAAETQSMEQLTWRVLGYRLLRAPSGLTYLEVSDGVKTLFITPEQAARRLKAKEQRNLSRLFDLAWRAMAIQRYDIGRDGFSKIQKREKLLDTEQKAQVNLGMATSSYHLEGCSKSVDSYLIEADRDVQNRDDVSFYRALCNLAREDYKDAEILFKDLVEKQHAGYSEASSFYLGVIAEADERFDEAETAYLDTIDFAADSSLVTLAQQRLQNVRALKQIHSYQTKWISGGLNLGIAYDSNVVALPGELSPASYGLTKQSSLVSTDIAFLSLTPPWSPSFTHSLSYNFLISKHFDEGISKIYDSHAHDIGTQFQFNSSLSTSHSLGYSWSSISLGPLGSSQETLRSQTAYYLLRNMVGSSESRTPSFLDLTFRFLAIRPTLPVTIPETNLNSNGYAFTAKYSRRSSYPHVHGPEGTIEVRPSEGSENSLRELRGGYFWDYTFAGGRSPWYVSQSGYFSFKTYYESALKRKDYALNYLGSIGRTWGGGFDTKLQAQGILNFSTRKIDYQYKQSSISLLVTAYF